MRLSLIFVLQILFTIGIFGQNKIVKYEYWFDNDFAGRTTSSVSPVSSFELNAAIPVSGLTNGVHILNVRFQDSNLKWSSILSQFFYKMQGVIPGSDRKIIRYEYWFDGDFESRTVGDIPPSDQFNLIHQIPVGGISEGVHIINIRFKDDIGQWSSTLSQFFYSMPAQSVVSNKIEAYRYWIDNDFSKLNYVSVDPSKNLNLITSLNLTDVPAGKHGIHFQFRDAFGLWSSVTADSIERIVPPVSIENKLEAGVGASVMVYPNPTAGMIKVDFGEIRNVAKVELMDSKGRVLYEINSFNSRFIELPVLYPEGIYILKIVSGDLQEVVRIVKQ